MAIYAPNPDKNMTTTIRQMKPVGPNWSNTFEITWDVVVSKGEKHIKKIGGVIQCSICLYLENIAGAFDIGNPWNVNIDSSDIFLFGSAAIRWLMPSGPRVGMLRMLVYQSFAIDKLLPRYTFGITIRGTALRTDIADGRLQHGDKMRADVSVDLEEEWGQISVEGFDD